jgi:hypothetical protein
MDYLTKLQTVSCDNKYYKWYSSICQRALAQNSQIGYTERHHILPKSLGLGGEKDPANIVRLTAKEHYIVHMLLVRFLRTTAHLNKMKYAMWYLSTRNIDYKPTSRSYESARIQLINTIKNRIDSAETRRRKARPGKLNGMYGKTHSAEVKEKLSKLRKDTLTGKTYEELYGVEKAQELKKDKSVKLKAYFENNSEIRKGSNNSNSKSYKFTDSIGTVYIVNGTLKIFCQLHGLSVAAIIDVAKGRKPTYKGWTVCYIS